MLKIAASTVVALASYFATSIDDTTLEPVQTATAELVILGKLPLIPYHITFDPILFVVTAFILWKIIKPLHRWALSILQTKMWDPSYLNQISI